VACAAACSSCSEPYLEAIYKAIELERDTRRRTGRELQFAVETRQSALEELLRALHVAPDAAHVDPTRTLVEVDGALWTLVAARAARLDAPTSSLRRAGAKHKNVR
jgi:hypothetical protein